MFWRKWMCIIRLRTEGGLLSNSSILPIDKTSCLLQLFLGARSEWNGFFIWTSR
jgi:hypothetical protein